MILHVEKPFFYKYGSINLGMPEILKFRIPGMPFLVLLCRNSFHLANCICRLDFCGRGLFLVQEQG